MKAKFGRILAFALLLMVAGQYAFTYDYVAAAAWCSLAVALLAAGNKPPVGQKTPKTARQYVTLLCILLALGLFGFQLYRDLTDHGASRIKSTTPVRE